MVISGGHCLPRAKLGTHHQRAKGRLGVRANDVSIATASADDRFPNSTKAASALLVALFYSARVTGRR
jgi:hypothetical protein